MREERFDGFVHVPTKANLNQILQHVAVIVATIYMNRYISVAKYGLTDKKVQVFYAIAWSSDL
jgi:hypothetical protein